MFSKTYAVRAIMVLQLLLVYAVSSAVSNTLIERLGRIGVFVLIILALYDWHTKKIKNIIFPDKGFNIFYWSFFILILVSSFFIGYQDSLHAAYSYSRYSILTFLVFYFLFQRNLCESSIILGITGGVGTICAFILQQFFYMPLGTRISGSLFDNPNFPCMLLVTSLPFLVLYLIESKSKKIWRISLIIILFITCFVIAITGSRGGIIGICISGVIYLLIHTLYIRKFTFKKLRLNYLAITLVILSIGCSYMMIFHSIHGYNNLHQQKQTGITRDQQEQTEITRTYDNQRILFWKSSYQMWQDHKLLGVGINRWKQEYYSSYILPEATEKNIGQPHNIFVFFFATTGIIGGIGFLLFSLGMFVYLCRLLKQNPNNVLLNALIWSFGAILLHSLVDRGILFHNLMFLYNAYLGIGLASVAYHKRIAKH